MWAGWQAASQSETQLNISTHVTWQVTPRAAGPSRVGASLTARGYDKQVQRCRSLAQSSLRTLAPLWMAFPTAVCPASKGKECKAQKG